MVDKVIFIILYRLQTTNMYTLRSPQQQNVSLMCYPGFILKYPDMIELIRIITHSGLLLLPPEDVSMCHTVDSRQ